MMLAAVDRDALRRERLLRVLSLAAFIIFFQAFMVAPLIPELSRSFGVSAQKAGLIVPASGGSWPAPSWPSCC